MLMKLVTFLLTLALLLALSGHAAALPGPPCGVEGFRAVSVCRAVE